jgi:uncharacterized protein
MIDDIEKSARRLEERIAAYGGAIVGFSAGVDSSVVAVAAHRALGDRALAVTAVTETITPEDLQLAARIAHDAGIAHELIHYSELAIPNYSANPSNRCYYCKDALYVRLAALAAERGSVVLDGTNADDEGDFRPGRTAAREQDVRSPLLELGIGKRMVRALAGHYGLPNADKPSAPCLSSRVPYGTEITTEILLQIGNGERALREMGFSELRVRHHGDVARVELGAHEMQRAFESAEQIDAALRDVGYKYVALDLRGFRSGSLNESLTQIELPTQ